MQILVTGSKGFIGKNLIAELKATTDHNLLEVDKETNTSTFESFCKEADFVFHLAGVNRPKNEEEFLEGNFGLTSTLLDNLKKFENQCPVMLASSIQAELENPYGISKKAGENLLFDYSENTGAKVLVYRFPNVFGKWSKPNYNSAVATFCHNIARDLSITINDPNVMMNLVYIDDVIKELMNAIGEKENKSGNYCEVPTVYHVQLGKITELLYEFKQSREERSIPNMADSFTKKLYSTYLSFLPEEKFSYPLKMNRDERGSFTEIIRTPDRGQVSVNISKPGVTKGNHWHHTKNEKFIVVSGQGIIRFREINSEKIIEYQVTGDSIEVLDIPVGCTHNIENIGETDLVTVMWVNESFDSKNPDTYYLEV